MGGCSFFKVFMGWDGRVDGWVVGCRCFVLPLSLTHGHAAAAGMGRRRCRMDGWMDGYAAGMGMSGWRCM